jgi:hypothetical protein
VPPEGGGVTVELPPPQPTRMKASNRKLSGMTTAYARRCCAEEARKRERKASSAEKRASTRAIVKSPKPLNGHHGRPTSGETMEGAAVVTCTVNVAAAVPFGVAEVSEGVQLESAGAPVQLSATVPLNPLTGAISKL